MVFHSDFDLPWCQALLKSEIDIYEVPRRPDDTIDEAQSTNQDSDPSQNTSMFAKTLYTPQGIKAQINFTRTSKEPDAVLGYEVCYLVSMGTDLDGKAGRAHGGFNALALDQVTGTAAARAAGSIAPATATMIVDYKVPIDTPQVILCRGWAAEKTGRKTWVKGVLEDGTGKVLASCKALFVDPKPSKM